MFDNFTDRARAVITQARDKALDMCHESIGVRHLMLALLEDSNSVCHAICKNLKISTVQVSEAIKKISQHGIGNVTRNTLALTEAAVEVLSLAEIEASELGSRYVGTEHIFLSILHYDCDTATLLRNDFSLSYAGVRNAMDLIPIRVPIDCIPEQFMPDLYRLHAAAQMLEKKYEQDR